MGKCTILLTNYYPYYKGEEYLETEIEFLVAKFEKVIIIPTMVNSEMKQTRQVPGTVEVINIDYRHTKINKVKNSIKRSNGVKSNSNKLSHRLYQNYFNNRSLEVTSKIIEKIKLIDFDQYDGIILYSYWLYITAQSAVILNDKFFKGRAKIISRAHRYDLYEEESKLQFLPSRKYLLENIDMIYPCSDDGKNSIIKRYPEYDNKIKTRRLGTAFVGDNSFRKEEPFEIVSCSAMRPVKRVSTIVKALRYLEFNDISYHWTHFGDGEEYESIKLLAKKELTAGNYCLKGFQSNSEVLKFYENKSVGCFINVSKSEGIPVSIMEAISFSIPVIATNVGGTREIVIDDTNGYILDENITDEDLSIKIIELISNDNYADFRLNSTKIWEEMYDNQKNYSKFVNEIYKL